MNSTDGMSTMGTNVIPIAVYNDNEDEHVGLNRLTVHFAVVAAAALLVVLLAFAAPARADITPTLSTTYANTYAGASTDVTMVTTFPGSDDVQRLAFDLPTGMIGNPNAITSANRCAVDYTGTPPAPDYSSCPPSSDVGDISVNVSATCNTAINVTGDLYLLRNRPTADPEVPTRLGIHVAGTCTVLLIPLAISMDFTAEIRLRPDDTGLRVFILEDLARTDPIIGGAIKINSITQTMAGTVGGQPFMKNPTRCDAWVSKAYVRAYGTNGNVDSDIDPAIPGNDHKQGSSTLAAPGCGSLAAFNAGFTLTQSTTQAGQPVGLTATVTNTIADPQPSHVKRVDLAFPTGFQINPAITNQIGSAGCSTAQFNEADPDTPPTCPAATQVGTVAITTPLITGAVNGQVYLGQPLDSGPNRYRLMVFALNGASVKFEARANVATDGTVTVAFGDAAVVGKSLPQVPWSQFQLVFFSGNRAMLTNPQVCGTYPATATVTPWTSPDQAAVVRITDLSVTAGPNTSGCDFDTFSPSFAAELSDTGAGKHPNLSLAVTRGDRQDNINDMTFRLPTGFAAFVTAAPSCPTATAAAGACTSDSQVGTIAVDVGTGPETATLNGTVHLTDPSVAGELALHDIGKLAIQVPAVVGPFDLGVTVIWARFALNSRTDFGLDSITTNMPQMIQGVPVRYRSVVLSFDGIIGSGASATQLMRNPAACGTLDFRATLASAGQPPASDVSTSVLHDTDQSTTGCAQPFDPTITVTPTSTETAKPTGLTVTIHVPQTMTGVTTSTIQNSTVKRVQIAMPPGMEINPAFTNGLTACSTANIDAGGGACLPSSQIGTVNVVTPLLPGSYDGQVFVEASGATLADRYKTGVVVHLPSGDLILHGVSQLNGSGQGADSGTGQVTSDFSNLPDVPYTSFAITFYSGANAMFTNPSTCASQTFSADLTPVSPGSAIATRTAAYTTSYDGAGGACPDSDPFAPTFTGSVTTTAAGGHPDLAMAIEIADKSQQLRSLGLHLPTGVVANTSATTRCSQLDAAAGNCAPGQQVGSVTTDVGSGDEISSLSGGIYNTEPNADEPARLTAIVPVVVGPFDLGKLSIPVATSMRADWGVNTAAQPPLRYEGIAVHIRGMRMLLNGTVGGKPFMTNPSKCQDNTITADMTAPSGDSASGSFSFITTDCSSRSFSPAMSFTAAGGDLKTSPEWNVKLSLDEGNSTMRSTNVVLPSIVTINVQGLGELCEAEQAATAWACPAASKTGEVSITTPLLPVPVTGSVFLARGYQTALPDMLIMLGAPINRQIRGTNHFVNSVQIESTFDGLPDLAWTELNMKFYGGPKGILGVRASGQCGSATADFASHSGQSVSTLSPVNGLFACTRGSATCDKPDVTIGTKGVKRKGNRRSQTAMSFRVPTGCAGIKSLRMLYPKGTKINRKLIKYARKIKKLRKNLQNITGRAGSLRLKVSDFATSGRTGIKIRSRLPANTRTIAFTTRKSSVALPYKAFCGAITGKGRTKKAKLKKCRNKRLSFSFVVTRADGSVLRYVHKVKAGDRKFK